MSSIEGYRGPESAQEQQDVREARQRFLHRFKDASFAHIEAEHADKQYHGREHTELVAEHVQDILSIVRSFHPERVQLADMTAGVAAAYAHDRVQQATADPDTGKLRRAAGWEEGRNEFESNAQLQDEIDAFIHAERERCREEACREDYLADLTQFFSQVKERSAAAIKATVPGFENAPLPVSRLYTLGLSERDIATLRSPEYLGKELVAMKVEQPNIDENADIVTLALALADLSQVGRLPFEEALTFSNREFREHNYDIDTYGARLQAGETLRPAEAQHLYTEYCDWSRSQVGFMLWQWLRFNELLNTNTTLDELSYGDDIREAIRGKYTKFRENIDKQMVYVHELSRQYGPATPSNAEDLRRFYRKEILRERN